MHRNSPNTTQCSQDSTPMDFDELEQGFALLRQLQDEETAIKTAKQTIQYNERAHQQHQIGTIQNHMQKYHPSTRNINHTSNLHNINGSISAHQQTPTNTSSKVQYYDQTDRNFNHGMNYENENTLNDFHNKPQEQNQPSEDHIPFNKFKSPSLVNQSHTPQQRCYTQQQRFSVMPQSAQKNALYSNFVTNRLLNSPHAPHSASSTMGIYNNNNNISATLPHKTQQQHQPSVTHSLYITQRDALGAIKSPLNAALASITASAGVLPNKTNFNHFHQQNENRDENRDENQNQNVLMTNPNYPLTAVSTTQNKYQENQHQQRHQHQQQLQQNNHFDTDKDINQSSIISTTPTMATSTNTTPRSSSTIGSSEPMNFLSLATATAQKREKLAELLKNEQTLKSQLHLFQNEVHSNNIIVAQHEKDVTITNYQRFMKEISPFENDLITELNEEYQKYTTELDQINERICNIEITQTLATQHYNSLLEQINQFNENIVEIQRDIDIKGHRNDDQLSHGNNDNKTTNNNSDDNIINDESMPTNQRQRYIDYIIQLKALMILENQVNKLVNELIKIKQDTPMIENNNNTDSNDREKDTIISSDIIKQEDVIKEKTTRNDNLRQKLKTLQAQFNNHVNTQDYLVAQINYQKQYQRMTKK